MTRAEVVYILAALPRGCVMADVVLVRCRAEDEAEEGADDER